MLSEVEMKQVLLYLLHALLHSVCAIVVVPYIALALFFVVVGQVARSKGILEVIDTLWNNFYYFIGWGIYVVPVLWICLIAMGFVSSLQRAGSLCLFVLSTGSLIVIVIFPSTQIELGHLLFFAPCIAVIITCTLLFFRGYFVGSFHN